MNIGFRQPVSGNAVSFLGSFGAATLLEQFSCPLQVALRFDQGATAVHNSRAAFFSEFFDASG